MVHADDERSSSEPENSLAKIMKVIANVAEPADLAGSEKKTEAMLLRTPKQL